MIINGVELIGGDEEVSLRVVVKPFEDKEILTYIDVDSGNGYKSFKLDSFFKLHNIFHYRSLCGYITGIKIFNNKITDCKFKVDGKWISYKELLKRK